MSTKLFKISPARLLFFLLGVAVSSIFWPIPASRLAFNKIHSLRIVDRNGELLREVLSTAQGYGAWVELEQIAPDFLHAVISTEDRAFFLHRGVDLAAILRASWQNLVAGQIVSGGSTLTMQLVRQLYDIRPNLWGKLREIWLALRLENTISKQQILAQYVNRVPFGNLTYGIEAAARFYFERPARHLSLAQASMLAGLPQAPSFLNPLHNFAAARKRQERVLQAMRATGAIGPQALQEAIANPLDFESARGRFRAPHAVDMAVAALKSRRIDGLPVTLRLTIDLPLQTQIEKSLASEIKQLQRFNVTNAAVVVIDNQSGEILALVGSADYFSESIHGQVNGALALRQPGSALKPFTYLLALENGFNAASVLPDIPLNAPANGGDFMPQNYDRRFHGPVRLRQALACSYNVPAVYVLQSLGTAQLRQLLRNAGFFALDKPGAYYGLGLTLGNGEVTLLQLARAFSGLARGGVLPGLQLTPDAIPILASSYRGTYRFAGEEETAIITDILADNVARVPAFGEDNALALPFPCAAKTGTTKDYRDNWTVGFTTDFTVGVWVGNFDGSAMLHVSGISGAGPIFRDVMLTLHRQRLPKTFAYPSELVEVPICTASGQTPQPFCPNRKDELFVNGSQPHDSCTMHQIVREPGTGRSRLALIFPPEFQDWARSAGMQQPLLLGAPPGDAVASVKPRPDPSKMVILFPDNGDVFKIDPVLRRDFQTIELTLRAPPSVHTVDWFIDSQKQVSVGPPFVYHWTLRPGMHTIFATTPDGQAWRSKPVTFAVLP